MWHRIMATLFLTAAIIEGGLFTVSVSKHDYRSIAAIFACFVFSVLCINEVFAAIKEK